MSTSYEQQNPYTPPAAAVTDAGQVVGVELAGRGARFAAVLLDGLISIGIFLPALIGAGLSSLETMDLSAFLGLGGAITAIGSLAWAAYTIYLVHTNAQTIGKKLMSIKVARTDGSRASLARIFWLRNVVNTIPSLVPFVGNLYGLVDPAFIFGDKRRCVHDLIADTIVVKA